jgi:hypothetical protein
MFGETPKSLVLQFCLNWINQLSAPLGIALTPDGDTMGHRLPSLLGQLRGTKP